MNPEKKTFWEVIAWLWLMGIACLLFMYDYLFKWKKPKE